MVYGHSYVVKISREVR
jgi:hypothetical protein